MTLNPLTRHPAKRSYVLKLDRAARTWLPAITSTSAPPINSSRASFVT
jgi:hypothetical protein